MWSYFVFFMLVGV